MRSGTSTNPAAVAVAAAARKRNTKTRRGKNRRRAGSASVAVEAEAAAAAVAAAIPRLAQLPPPVSRQAQPRSRCPCRRPSRVWRSSRRRSCARSGRRASGPSARRPRRFCRSPCGRRRTPTPCFSDTSRMRRRCRAASSSNSSSSRTSSRVDLPASSPIIGAAERIHNPHAQALICSPSRFCALLAIALYARCILNLRAHSSTQKCEVNSIFSFFLSSSENE